jgi:arylformamidase
LIENYPPQEPFTSIGAKYHTEVLRRGEAVRAIEVAYGRDPYQRLAVVPADRPNGDVLVAFHGGGWTNGYREWMLFMAPALTARGVTFVSAGYRLAPEHVFPEGYHDALAPSPRRMTVSVNGAAIRAESSSEAIRPEVISRHSPL